MNKTKKKRYDFIFLEISYKRKKIHDDIAIEKNFFSRITNMIDCDTREYIDSIKIFRIIYKLTCGG